MRTYLIAFVLSLVAGLVSTRVIRDLALRFGLYDSGGGRKLHKRPVPRLGGVAVAISAAVPLMGVILWSNNISAALLADRPLLVGGLGGGLIMLAVGIWDDLRDSRAVVKLAAQIAAATVVCVAGIQIEAVSVPFFGPVHLGMLSAPVTVFWMVLVMNAVNLIDGLDGLAGGVVVLAGGTLFIMSVLEDNTLAALLLVVVVGATLGFLAYNINPATIFLGDTGSLFLGFVLALVSVHSSQKSYTLFSIVAAMLALGLPIFDLGMAVVRRYLSGQPIFRADQHHVHHLLLRKGLTQSQAVVTLYAGAVVLGGLALVFIYADDQVSALAMAALVPLVFLAVKVLGYGDVIKTARRAQVLEQAEVEAAARASELHGVRAQMERVEDREALWALVVEAAKVLGFTRVELRLIGEEGPPRCWSATRLGDTAGDVHVQGLESRELRLHAGPTDLGSLHVLILHETEVMRPMGAALCQVLADGISHALLGMALRRSGGLDVMVRAERPAAPTA